MVVYGEGGGVLKHWRADFMGALLRIFFRNLADQGGR